MAYNLATAAAATGKTKSTILKSIQKGRISAHKDAFGNWNIDPAEVHRVYPPVSEKVENEQTGTGVETKETGKIRELEAKVNLLEEICADLKAEREAQRAEAAEWRRTITALLPPPQQPEEKPPEQRPVTFWDMFWPFGRRA